MHVAVLKPCGSFAWWCRATYCKWHYNSIRPSSRFGIVLEYMNNNDDVQDTTDNPEHVFLTMEMQATVTYRIELNLLV